MKCKGDLSFSALKNLKRSCIFSQKGTRYRIHLACSGKEKNKSDNSVWNKLAYIGRNKDTSLTVGSSTIITILFDLQTITVTFDRSSLNWLRDYWVRTELHRILSTKDFHQRMKQWRHTLYNIKIILGYSGIQWTTVRFVSFLGIIRRTNMKRINLYW